MNPNIKFAITVVTLINAIVLTLMLLGAEPAEGSECSTAHSCGDLVPVPSSRRHHRPETSKPWPEVRMPPGPSAHAQHQPGHPPAHSTHRKPPAANHTSHPTYPSVHRDVLFRIGYRARQSALQQAIRAALREELGPPLSRPPLTEEGGSQRPGVAAIQRHCSKCHAGDAKRSFGVNFIDRPPVDPAKYAELLREGIKQVSDGEMPPSGKLPDAEAAAVLKELTALLPPTP